MIVRAKLNLVIAACIAAFIYATPPVQAETVNIPTGNETITAELYRPQGAGPFPAVVALHGCSGLYRKDKADLSARHRDWADRFVAAGYAVLFPDSFTARGFDQICTRKERQITPQDRAEDALAATRWLSSQDYVDASRVNLLGWSHGAMSLLWTVRPQAMGEPPLFASAIAFYPGCRKVARDPDWRPAVPLTILIGASDDWTEPGPCRELAAAAGFKYVEYPGAYHDFDAPNIAVHLRTGLSAVRSGAAHIGTDPHARQAAIEQVMATFATARRGPANPPSKP